MAGIRPKSDSLAAGMTTDSTSTNDRKLRQRGQQCMLAWRGKLVILGGFLVHLTLGTLYTFGNVTTYLTSYVRAKIDPTFTYEQATWIYTGNMMAQGVFMTLGGYLEWRFGPRVTAFLGCSIATTGVATTAFSIDVAPWLVVFTYGVLFGLGTGIGYVVPLACGMRWFPDRKGLVTGTILGGFGLGSFIFTQVQTAILNPKNVSVDKETGYFSDEEILERVPFVFLLLGGTYAVMQLVGCGLMANPPPVDEDDEPEMTEVHFHSLKPIRHCSIVDVINPSQSRRMSVKASQQQRRRTLARLQSLYGEAVDEEEGQRQSSAETAPLAAVEDLPPSQTETEENKLMPPSSPKASPLKRVTIAPDDNMVATFEDDVASASHHGDTSLNPRQILRTREFYMLWLTFLFNQQAIGYISTMYKAYGLTFISNDRFLALVGAVASVFNSLGRIAWGSIGDRTCYRTAMMIVTATLTVLFITFPFSEHGGEAMYSILVIAIFSTFCGNFALLPTATCQTFGPTFAGTNYGLVFTSAIFSQPLQSILAGNLTGLIGSTGVLFVTAGFTALSFLLTFFFHKDPSPEKLRKRLGLPLYGD